MAILYEGEILGDLKRKTEYNELTLDSQITHYLPFSPYSIHSLGTTDNGQQDSYNQNRSVQISMDNN